MEASTQDYASTGTRDVLEKCRNYGRVVAGRFMRPSDIQAAGLYVYFEPELCTAPGGLTAG
jgi:hypothetical protein